MATNDKISTGYYEAVKQLELPRPQQVQPVEGGTCGTQVMLDLGSNFSPGQWWRFRDDQSCRVAFEKCGILSTVLIRLANAFLNGIPAIKNSRENDSSSEGAKALMKLLQQPNGYQTGQMFFAELLINTVVFGRTVLLPLVPVAATIDFTKCEAVAIVPNHWITYNMSLSQGINFKKGAIESIYISGINKTYSPDELIIIDDLLPGLYQPGEPSTRLRAIEENISNYIGAIQSRGSLIKQRGPRGALVPEISTLSGGAVPLKEGEKEKIEAHYATRYGMGNGQVHSLVAESALKYLNMGYDVKQLGLFEEVKDDSIAIANQLGYPTYLLGLEGATFSNQRDAGKFLYTQTIIPLADNICQQLGSYFGPVSDRLVMDYSHVPELQMDTKEKAEASKIETEDLTLQFKMNLLTLAEFKAKKGLVPLPGDENIKYSDIKEIIEFKPTHNGQQQMAGSQN